MNRYYARALALGLAAAALLTAPQSADAQPDELSAGVRVNFADLDIRHPAGASALLRRIEHAAVTACGGDAGPPLQAQSSAYRECRADAIRQAVSQVGAPMLTALAKPDVGPGRPTSH